MSSEFAERGDIRIDVPLVERLVATQFPDWAQLEVSPVTGGHDNRTFRLGREMSVRLPSSAAYAPQVRKEQHWLPKLAASLPLSIPMPLALGHPSANYPWDWSIYGWIEGENATAKNVVDRRDFAVSLAGFLRALQSVDTTHGPPPGSHSFFRGGPLATYDSETRQAIALLGDKIDTKTAKAVWAQALASTDRHSCVWLHGDISVGNLLIKAGRLHAVIDFGCLAVGDPACDFSIAWTFMDSATRVQFRECAGIDPSAWARARGWALWKALVTLTGANDRAAQTHARLTLDEIVAEHQFLGDSN